MLGPLSSLGSGFPEPKIIVTIAFATWYPPFKEQTANISSNSSSNLRKRGVPVHTFNMRNQALRDLITCSRLQN